MKRNEFPFLPGLDRPAFTDMLRCYNAYKATRGRLIEGNPHLQHQCGIRMSVALERCGISLNMVPGSARRTIAGGSFYTVSGATALANHLSGLWYGPDKTAEIWNFHEEFAGRKGIIYLQDYRHRGASEYNPDPTGELSGDHIDIWDGARLGNSIIHDLTHDHKPASRSQLQASVKLAAQHGKQLKPQAQFFALPDVAMSQPDSRLFLRTAYSTAVS